MIRRARYISLSGVANAHAHVNDGRTHKFFCGRAARLTAPSLGCLLMSGDNIHTQYLHRASQTHVHSVCVCLHYSTRLSRRGPFSFALLIPTQQLLIAAARRLRQAQIGANLVRMQRKGAHIPPCVHLR